MSVAEVEQDLSHIHWSWPEAVAANPARSLATADLAMDYFAYSPFWDSRSNNNVLRTQRRIDNPTYGHAEEKIELNAFMSGFEYIVAHSQPPNLFVIHRRDVESSGKRDHVTGAWFILQEKIYQCPSLYDVMSARLKNATSLISKTMRTLSDNRPPANPRTTTLWRSLPPSTSKPGPSSSQSPVVENDHAEAPANSPRELDLGEKPAGKTKEQVQEPDWHLFYALQSTRASLASLTAMSRAPGKKPDPKEELKSIEAAITQQFGGGGGQESVNGRSVVPRVAVSGAGSVKGLGVPKAGSHLGAPTPQGGWLGATPGQGTGSPAALPHGVTPDMTESPARFLNEKLVNQHGVIGQPPHAGASYFGTQ
ncbi:hypothetical protein B9479_004794 [Cryptococcus floricola]|uniref:Mediator of RNA polymerase II transcription subunit 6 n=1 Tax=Cryptococcus floricola TaxID=2591691 RepID=A0A5D3AXK0_9TREE|nr:hypothetical protein B9479_004794 [Cryptococcus floricola]